MMWLRLNQWIRIGEMLERASCSNVKLGGGPIPHVEVAIYTFSRPRNFRLHDHRRITCCLNTQLCPSMCFSWGATCALDIEWENHYKSERNCRYAWGWRSSSPSICTGCRVKSWKDDKAGRVLASWKEGVGTTCGRTGKTTHQHFSYVSTKNECN